MLVKVKIGNKLVGNEEPTFIVAEIGVNHNGNVETAKKLIDIAVSSGVDSVKFQKKTIEAVYREQELGRYIESPFGDTFKALKKGLEFGYREYSEIDDYCKQKGIMWFASCWDEGSVDFLEHFEPPCYKIASACLTNDNLLRHIRSKGKSVILSTGMSTMEQIKHAVEILGKHDLILLHCTSTYPCNESELNLKVIPVLKEMFNIPVGYSGHDNGIVASVMAVALGACMVEKHITLDRTTWGSDHAASLEPRGLHLLVRDIRLWPVCLGDGIKRVYNSEKPKMEKYKARIKG